MSIACLLPAIFRLFPYLLCFLPSLMYAVHRALGTAFQGVDCRTGRLAIANSHALLFVITILHGLPALVLQCLSDVVEEYSGGFRQNGCEQPLSETERRKLYALPQRPMV
jgi:hypothetical protein